MKWHGMLRSDMAITVAGATLNAEELKRALETELRWHYSNHYFAEKEGEAVIANLLTVAPSEKARNILTGQLRDELRHTSLYKGVVDKLGLDDRASGYAKAYSELVKNQKTFSEKVFVFQALTEAVSKAYIEWRLKAVKDATLNAIDASVLQDELKHLNLASPLLAMCSPQEIDTVLTPLRRKELLREMSAICKQSMQKDLSASVGVETPAERGPTELDALVTRALLSAAKNITKKAGKRNA